MATVMVRKCTLHQVPMIRVQKRLLDHSKWTLRGGAQRAQESRFPCGALRGLALPSSHLARPL